MNQTITIFTYEGTTNVRTLTTEDGAPLFCANDVATVLGYNDPKDALARHCKGVTNHYPIVDNLGRTQEARFITEGDIYRLIFNSKLPEAEKFEAWVVDEVLPSIRKHGMYATPITIDAMIADPDMAIKLLTTLKEERAARAKAEAEIEAQRPVAALGKAIETAEGDLTPSAFGKILSKTITTMGPNKFCRWLLDNNFAFRNGQGKIIPMQDAVNRGILILTERIDHAGKIRPQLLVTPAGQSYFTGILGA
nr:MAG TPA: repressor domain protein [Caudoviricetes sp.]